MRLPTADQAVSREAVLMGRECVLLGSSLTATSRGRVLTIIYSADSPRQAQVRVAVFDGKGHGSAWSSILSVETVKTR